MEKSDRISSAFIVFVPNKSLIIALIRFFDLRFLSLSEPGRDKKDAEASKSVTSPYNCTAEAVFGGRKSG